MKKFIIPSRYFIVIVGFLFALNNASAQDYNTLSKIDNANISKIKIDNLILESVITGEKRSNRTIYIQKNKKGLTIEDQTLGVQACIGVQSCNDMIAYCVGTLDSDPSCVNNNQGQPVGCVC